MLHSEWNDSPRWKGIRRDYSPEDVVRLRGSVLVEQTLARLGAEKLWRLINQEKPLCALGALTGNQAIQEIQAGLKAIYCSGWQVAGDGNSAGGDVPGPKSVSGGFSSQDGGANQQCVPAH